jgi:biotin transport system substrate-specific component
MARTMSNPNQAADLTDPIRLLALSSRVVGFALLLVLSARISFPVPGTPVPATLQVMAVLATGAFLGPWAGLASVATYLISGIAGAPVFAYGGGPGYLMGPTGGYLIGFLPAVCLAGLLSARARSLWSLFGSFTLACMVIHLSGWAQLTALGGPAEAFRVGVFPFMFLDLLKAFLTAALVQKVRSRRAA